MSEPSRQPYRPNRSDRARKRALTQLLNMPEGARRRLAGKPHIADGGALNFDIALGLRGREQLNRERLNSSVPARRLPSTIREIRKARRTTTTQIATQAPMQTPAHTPAAEAPTAGRPSADPDVRLQHARRELEREAWTVSGVRADVKSATAVTIPTRDGSHIDATLFLPKACPVTVKGAYAGASTPGNDELALVIYFHGGGWVVGSQYSHEPVARAICAGAEVAVLNVDYRLAPEHPFPTAVLDALDAFSWAHEHATEYGIDADRIAVAGDSAGGTLSAVVCQKLARDGAPTPAMQALLVPATDLTLPHSDSYQRFSQGYFLTADDMTWYKSLYLTGEAHSEEAVDDLCRHPDASPLLADDLPQLATAGLPPAYVAVAGFDPLRDEGIAYANALREAGVATTLRVHTDAVHPFINSLAAPASQRYMAELVGALRMGLHV